MYKAVMLETKTNSRDRIKPLTEEFNELKKTFIYERSNANYDQVDEFLALNGIELLDVDDMADFEL